MLGRFANIDPGIIDQDVHPAKGIDRGLDHGLNRRFVLYIGGHADGAAAELFQLGHRLRILGRPPPRDRYAGPGLHQSLGNAQTNTGIAASDNRHFAF